MFDDTKKTTINQQKQEVGGDQYNAGRDVYVTNYNVPFKWRVRI